MPSRAPFVVLALAGLVALALARLPPAGAQPIEPRTFAAGVVSETAILAALAGAQPGSFRLVGTSSLTFQVDLAGPIDAAFKPETRTHPRGWLSEVAAYRVARALGLDTVPPAVLRSVDRGQLRRRFEASDGTTFDDVAAELGSSGALARGAFIYWVPGLSRSDLDTPEGIRRWTRWLAQDGELPEADRTLARDLSNLVLFDYLIGNRDRWSGGNVRPASGRLVFRDHNLAFPFALGEGVHRRLLSFLLRAQRFSRQTVRRLLDLDEAALREAVADEDPASLLEDRQIAGVMERRATILSYVGALIEAHGLERVLCFD